MIMRITWGKLRSGSWQEFEQAYHNVVAGKAVQGLQGRWLAQDCDDPDGGFSVSLWATEADMRAYEQGDVYRQQILPALEPFFAGEFTKYHCDVKYSE